MEEKNKLLWAVPAYNHSKKSVDWFWALGLIILLGIIICVLFNNYFLAIILLVGGFMMGYFANEEPETLYYELNSEGIRIKDRLYPFAGIEAYFISLEKEPTLFIKTDRFFLPIVPIAINKNVADKIREFFVMKEIKEEVMKESPVEVIMEMIGY